MNEINIEFLFSAIRKNLDSISTVDNKVLVAETLDYLSIIENVSLAMTTLIANIK